MISGMRGMASVQDLNKCNACKGTSFAIFLHGMLPKVAGNEAQWYTVIKWHTLFLIVKWELFFNFTIEHTAFPCLDWLKNYFYVVFLS